MEGCIHREAPISSTDESLGDFGYTPRLFLMFFVEEDVDERADGPVDI